MEFASASAGADPSYDGEMHRIVWTLPWLMVALAWIVTYHPAVVEYALAADADGTAHALADVGASVREGVWPALRGLVDGS